MAPVSDDLVDQILGGGSPARRVVAPDRQRAFDEVTEALAQAALASLTPLPAPSTGRDRLLRAIGQGQRFAALVPRLVHLLDLPERAVLALLDKVDDAQAWISGFAPGVGFFNFNPGARHAGAEAGFVRVAVGATFPRHRHLGPEATLVIEGQMRDGDRRFGPGALIEHDAGTEHAWVNDGPVDLLLVSLHHGLAPA